MVPQGHEGSSCRSTNSFVFALAGSRCPPVHSWVPNSKWRPQEILSRLQGTWPQIAPGSAEWSGRLHPAQESDGSEGHGPCVCVCVCEPDSQTRGTRGESRVHAGVSGIGACRTPGREYVSPTQGTRVGLRAQVCQTRGHVSRSRACGGGSCGMRCLSWRACVVVVLCVCKSCVLAFIYVSVCVGQQ